MKNNGALMGPANQINVKLLQKELYISANICYATVTMTVALEEHTSVFRKNIVINNDSSYIAFIRVRLYIC